ncbi:hypothetical protein KP509_31G001700 [Ceratopteris richardii]|uniref:Protein kinase domain-containing protein n=1 Tax=Ceratopteris richardii TaxID=49495 RepID=A0A8T2QV67_CERRI|nr:hypothetical protein KP509_31G001700 [Ceratopteris richardii]KAH7287876.1 hypothetical protein KP509_31G001700 [Ceratopteris richardii]
MGNCSFTNLMLGFNDFSGNIPGDALGKWGHSITRQIDLQFNNFSGAIPPQIGNLTKLAILILNNNHLSGSFPKEIGRLSSLTGATFEHNLLSGNFPPQIFNCTKLLHLIIYDNNLGGPLPSTIGQTADLAYLEAQNNLLSGILPDALSNCTQLQNFSLAGNQLTGNIPDYLAASPSTLFLFDLSRNSFSGAISSSFGNKVQMQQLDLSHNKLTGSIPSELSLCLGLISMNLAFNSLRGGIPSSFGKSLESLTTLDLSFNSLSGGIPSELGSMRSLKYLDISSNNLTGSIPSTFLTAPSLQYINLSYNDIEGTIPDDRSSVFGNATAAWFLGNPRLCGEIIHRACPSSHRSVLKSKAAKVVYISVSILVLVILNLILLAVFLKRQKLQATRNLDVESKFMKLQLREIEEATNNFSNDNLIGCGAFGSVYKGVTKDGKVLAFKKFTLDSSSIHSFFRELEIVRQTRHRSLVKALGYWSNHMENNILVLEYMELGSLDAHLHHMGKPRSCKLSLQERWNVSSAIVDGLLYLHYECPNAPIVHCDIKPSNILFDSHMQPRISDFGLSRVLVDMVTSTQNLQGTLGYMAPECASSGRISPKCDVYSFGIIVIEMVTGVGPHDREILGENVTLLEWVRSKVSVGLYDEVLDGTMLAEYKKTLEIAEQIELLLNVALECTKDNPKDRPNIKEVHSRLEKSMFSMKAPFSGHNLTDSSKFSDSSIPDSWS